MGRWGVIGGETFVGHREQLKLLACGTLLLCITGSAITLAAEPLTKLLSCRAIPDAIARLACFDRETAVLAGAAPAAETAPATAPVAAAPSHGPAPAAPAFDATQQFGLTEGALAAREVAAGTRAADVADIKARLTAVSRGASGLLTFTLDNGQVWRQLKDSGELLARMGDPVTISRGWFRSFEIQLPSGRSCKVERLH
jgi:hypothetical protein